MSTSLYKLTQDFSLSKSAKLAIQYSLFLIVPYAASFILPIDNKGTYVGTLTLINLLTMMAFYLQFLLAGKFKTLSPFSNIDWSITKHKTIGQWIGVIFFLHPFLILLPKLALSSQDGLIALKLAIISPKMLTGLIAWGLMIIWIAISVFKNLIPIRYEIWRIFHTVGFIAIAIFATLHITSVGSHGQFQSNFNIMWWTLCAITICCTLYNHLIKPTALKNTSFKLTSIQKVSRCDWQMTLTQPKHANFDFEAGQFVWLNTNKSAYHLDYHPFSIASCRTDLPNISFIIRQLGDYTSHLDQLKVGQNVYLDGPYGSLSLHDSRQAKGITLIAGGAGIGPMLSLLKQLAVNKDPRPIQLLYGNNQLDQMVLQNEIAVIEQQIPNFRQQLVCQEHTDKNDIYCGVIDQHIIESCIPKKSSKEWAVYLCGPQGMVNSVLKSLSVTHIKKQNIHYEQLAF